MIQQTRSPEEEAPFTAPSPDPAEIARTLQVLAPGNGIVELRAIHTKGRKRTDAGYFDPAHRELLVAEAVRLNKAGAPVYFNLNELDPQLLARYANRVQEFAPATASDNNIIQRRWLLIDVDPQRPKDTSATQEQCNAALKCAGAVYRFLGDRGWPKPVVAESGNGLHILFRIGLPNDGASNDLIKQCLEVIAARFDTQTVKIDRTVFNAARIDKLYGTVACKGDHTPAAPWRLSRLRAVPEEVQCVSLEQLRALAAEAPQAGKGGNGQSDTHRRDDAWTEANVAEFLARGGIEAAGSEPHNGGLRWKLKVCPFNSEHGPGKAAVFLQPDGRLGFKCLHNSCQDKHWSDLRARVDGEREQRAKTEGNGELPQPVPLVRTISAPEPYPIDALGKILGPAAKAIAELVQVPAALAGNSVLAAAALAAQAQGNVCTLGGVRPLSLYVLTIAESGERKSTADTIATAPIHDRMATLLKEYRVKARVNEAQAEAHKMRVRQAKETAASAEELEKALLQLPDIESPRKPWMLASEPTPEGLLLALKDGQLSQGLFNDEGGQFIGGHALSEEAELRTIAMLSRAWEGAPLDRVRAKDREHVTLYGRRLSLHLMAQPEVANRLLANPLYRAQGFVARFLIAQPGSLIGTRQHNGQQSAIQEEPRLRGYYAAVARLLSRPAVENHDVGGLDPPCIALAPEARKLLVDAYNEIEAAQAGDGELSTVRGFASKASEHACRIAAVMALVSNPEAAAVEVEHMRSALQLVEFYTSEQVRLASAATVSVEIANAQKLLDWLKRKGLTDVTPKKVMQLGPGIIRDATSAKVALRTLVEFGWLATGDGHRYCMPLTAQAALRECL